MVDRLSPLDRRLLTALEPGLAITARPYEALAACAGISEVYYSMFRTALARMPQQPRRR